MALLKSLIFFLCCLLLVKSDGVTQGPEQPNPIIRSVLDYLNSNPNKVYDYKRGSLLSSLNKGDILEISAEVEVDCNGNWFPEIPCSEHVLICHAFMRRDPIQADAYRVLSDMRCSPRRVEDVDDVRSVAPMVFGEQDVSVGKIDLSNEAVPPGQGNADFVAVRNNNGPCLGCPYDLNRDAEGVDELIDTAVKHIESERDQRHKIINVRRLQQQVVAGLKYILLADVARTTCSKDADVSAPCVLDDSTEPFICEITFIEKPWINKNKHIIKNNCTASQEFEPVGRSRQDRNDISNEIIPHKDLDKPSSDDEPKPDMPNYNHMAQTGNIDESLDTDRLADLESQIVFGDMLETNVKPIKTKSTFNMASPPHFIEDEYVTANEPTDFESLRVEPLNSDLTTLFESMYTVSEPYLAAQNEYRTTSIEGLPATSDFLEFDSYLPFQERFIRESDADQHNILEEDSNTSKDDKKKKVSRDANDSTSEESSESKNSTESDSSSQERNYTTTLSTVDIVKRQIATTSEEESKSKDSAEGTIKRPKRNAEDSSSSSSSSSSESNGKSEEQTKRPSAKEKSDSDQHKKHNKETIEEKSDSSSSESSSSESDNFDKKGKKHKRDKAFLSYENNEVRRVRSIGQLEKISPDEKMIVRDLADFAAATLDNIDDDHHKRVILQILGARKLKLDGIYYQIILRLGISHCHENEHHENCREKLFTNLTKICKVQVHVDDDYSNPKVVKSQCQNIKKDENDRNRTNYSRYKRGLVGGISPTSTDDADVQKFVKATLEHLDSVSNHPNKHQSIEIISASSQIVAGVRYVITAKIGLSNCAKSEDKSPDTCESLTTPEPEICVIDVWDRSWLNKTIYNISCNEKKYSFNSEEESRVKREIINETEDLEEAFRRFAIKHNRFYRDEMEYNFRLKVFRDNLNKIALFNKYEKGTARYGVTKFSDLTEKEFSRSHGYRPDLRVDNELPFSQAEIPKINLPVEFDWRTKEAVTEVKNQGMCGSCWAFSVTGNVEGQYAISHGKLLTFSEQELVDCDKTDDGCNGGLMDNAYRAIEKLGGLESESDYPYEGDDETCSFNPAKVEVRLSGAVNISHNETDMAKWLVKNGPISIAINANAMQFYMGGVSHPWKALCNPNNLDHGVLIVGYGVHKYSLFNKTLPYWIVKNSWGTSWGEQGYYRVYRGDGTCGLNQTPSSAIVA